MNFKFQFKKINIMIVLMVATLIVVIILMFPNLTGESPLTNTGQNINEDINAPSNENFNNSPEEPQDEAPEETQADTPEASNTPELTTIAEESTQTLTPTVFHLEFPSSPVGVSSFVHDAASKVYAAERRAVADWYQFLVLERPFTANVMDYIDYIDLNLAEMEITSPWIYLTLYLEGAPPADSEAFYGVEFDLDIDGRGDWLVLGMVPKDTTWTSDGVFVYQDLNNDNGGPSPMWPDGVLPELDGYEELFYDQGYGAPDPDTAWIRRDPSNPMQVQIAIKYVLINNDDEFLWGAWAHQVMPDPALYDFHDHFTLVDAGSPVKDADEYPIKEIAAVDNTCRWSYGFDPVGTEPGVCYIQPTPTPTPSPTPPPNTPTPTPTPLPGTISGGVWKDLNGNGVVNGGEPGFSGVTVRLGQGSCLVTGYRTALTAVNGSYSFTNVPAGIYCISVNIVVECAGWIATTATQHTINLSPDENKYVSWIGYASYNCP